MPRVGSFRQLDRIHLTPFARLIYDYLASQMPTMLVSELAAESGISNNAIWSWLKHGIVPRRQTVIQLAERVPDLSLDELLAAAGLPSTDEVRAARATEAERLRDSVALVERLILDDPTISAAAKAELARTLETLRAQPDAFLHATDTYREYNAASPAEYEAQRATEQAQVYEPDPITTPEEAHGQPRPPRPQRAERHSDHHPDHHPDRRRDDMPSRPTGA